MSEPATPAPRATRFVVSALFDSASAVDESLARLYEAGVPRDLIEVVVGPEASRRFYGGKAAVRKHEAFRFAGVGGVIGVVAGAALGIGVVALPGFADPGLTSVVQLLGPNVATIGGALVGAAIGAFIPRKPAWTHRRAAEAPNRIVVVVVARAEGEVGALQRVLTEAGGSDARLEPEETR